MAHDGLVLSADKKVIKLWDREKVRAVTFTAGIRAEMTVRSLQRTSLRSLPLTT